MDNLNEQAVRRPLGEDILVSEPRRVNILYI